MFSQQPVTLSHLPFLTQMYAFHVLPPYFCQINPNTSFHLSIGLESCLYPAAFPTKTLYVFLFSHIHTTCPAHLILGVSPEQYLGRATHQQPIFFSLLLFPPSWAQIFTSRIPFSNNLGLRSSLNTIHQVPNPYKNRQTYISAYCSLYVIRQRMERHTILDQTVACILKIYPARNLSIRAIFVCQCIPNN